MTTHHSRWSYQYRSLAKVFPTYLFRRFKLPAAPSDFSRTLCTVSFWKGQRSIFSRPTFRYWLFSRLNGFSGWIGNVSIIHVVFTKTSCFWFFNGIWISSNRKMSRQVGAMSNVVISRKNIESDVTYRRSNLFFQRLKVIFFHEFFDWLSRWQNSRDQLIYMKKENQHPEIQFQGFWCAELCHRLYLLRRSAIFFCFDFNGNQLQLRRSITWPK